MREGVGRGEEGWELREGRGEKWGDERGATGGEKKRVKAEANV